MFIYKEEKNWMDEKGDKIKIMICVVSLAWRLRWHKCGKSNTSLSAALPRTVACTQADQNVNMTQMKHVNMVM